MNIVGYVPGHLYENASPITTTIFQPIFDSVESANIIFIFPRYQPGFSWGSGSTTFSRLQLVFRVCACQLLVWIQLQPAGRLEPSLYTSPYGSSLQRIAT